MSFLTVNNNGFTICEQKLTLKLMQQLVGNPNEMSFIDIVCNQFSDKNIMLVVDDIAIPKKLPLTCITQKKLRLYGQVLAICIIGGDWFGLSELQVKVVKKQLTYITP